MNDKQTTESQNARWWARAGNEIERLCTAIAGTGKPEAGEFAVALGRMANALDKIYYARLAIEERHAAAKAALRHANESLARLWAAAEAADDAMAALHAAVEGEPLPDTRNPL